METFQNIQTFLEKVIEVAQEYALVLILVLIGEFILSFFLFKERVFSFNQFTEKLVEMAAKSAPTLLFAMPKEPG